MHTYKAAPDVDVVTSTATIAGFGKLAINAFVIHADEPVLVDTGSVVESDDFMAALRSVIDPADLRWIWLTHTDFDHIGSLQRLLDRERAAAGDHQLPRGRDHEPVGTPADGSGVPRQPWSDGRRGRSHPRARCGPPPSTTPSRPGSRTNARASSSARIASEPCSTRCPNAPRTCPTRTCIKARSSGPRWTPRGCTRWTGAVFASELDHVRALEPTMVLSSHLPAAQGSSVERLLGALAAVPDAPAFVGPDQAALEQMLAGVTGSPTRSTGRKDRMPVRWPRAPGRVGNVLH